MFARTVDMRASPYDVEELGLEPIRIETDEGKAAFRGLQREVMEKAAPVRERLRLACEALMAP